MDTILSALTALKKGEIIIVVDDENRENEGDFVMLAEHVTPEAINYMATKGKGLICTPITQERAQQLKLNQMVTTNTDQHGTAFTVSIDHADTHTGISAYERAQTVQGLLKPDAKADNFKRPGHIFPLVAKEQGVLARPGHTEAAVDLAKLAGSVPAGVICEIMSEDGQMARLPELILLAKQENMKIVTIKDLIHYRKQYDQLINHEVEIELPTAYGLFKMIAYTENGSGKEQIALVKGQVNAGEPPLVRVHSECLTGDVFRSERCDCGPQLEQALAEIESAGNGIIIYLRQEGRGIGLVNKLKAYKLQEAGFDTVEANQQLGFADDLRDYASAAQILQQLGVNQIKLLTNNPRKVTGLKQYGISVVERKSIEISPNQNNSHYLMTKQVKLGHLLHGEGELNR
ncbi:3,4-dihydroxy 2-butanone 4-phosphate synthase / GTP cyclohydrolase II [Amphibacillus marinus]|uniref:Riboflavin biosynthesis protein RibBA n=1 Tax=Amphibacillus marinus TaxID=872970 RepID=A0A1H8JUA4_9BACI|nr:bifunctional 3,4-dihydroxy-2-butanone-4-phosphate synthase/GTP cyclohydrolase II [Amphibacillus marinus]SEN84085.1 3,4-dihydroxy 2-butanone 4-phosphate synthase / GTP cyclohydrolase II [Amphibacillus marinus]